MNRYESPNYQNEGQAVRSQTIGGGMTPENRQKMLDYNEELNRLYNRHGEIYTKETMEELMCASSARPDARQAECEDVCECGHPKAAHMRTGCWIGQKCECPGYRPKGQQEEQDG
jgi:hypothetical protein